MVAWWLATVLVSVGLGAADASASATQPSTLGPAVQPPERARRERGPRWTRREHSRQRDRWRRLPPEEREELQRIWEKLQDMPREKRRRLMQTLVRYRMWLRDLPPEARERVLRMAPKERLGYIGMFGPPRHGMRRPPAPEGAESAEGRRRFLRELRAFFAHLDEPVRQRLWRMPPDRQERELRRLFFQARQRRRMGFFHETLTPEQRHEILSLHRQDPAGAEKRFRRLWAEHHGPPAPASQPAP